MALALLFFVVGAFLNQALCRPDADRIKNVGIIGGHSIKIEEAPYMASVRQYSDHVCGGTIIHEQFILTAADCIVNLEEDGVTISEGIQVLVGTSYTNGTGGTIYDVDTIKFHNGYYNTYTNDCDIALIKLLTPLTFGPKVAKINYDVDLDIKAGDKLRATGWGDTKYDSEELPSRLRQVKLSVISEEECEEIYKDEDTEITSKMICAGGNGRDTCAGDSGGPLTYNDDSHYVVVGVIAGGKAGECGKTADYFTKVASFSSWIRDTITSLQ